MSDNKTLLVKNAYMNNKQISFNNYPKEYVLSEIRNSIYDYNFYDTLDWITEANISNWYEDIWEIIFEQTCQFIFYKNPNILTYITTKYDEYKQYILELNSSTLPTLSTTTTSTKMLSSSLQKKDNFSSSSSTSSHPLLYKIAEWNILLVEIIGIITLAPKYECFELHSIHRYIFNNYLLLPTQYPVYMNDTIEYCPYLLQFEKKSLYDNIYMFFLARLYQSLLIQSICQSIEQIELLYELNHECRLNNMKNYIDWEKHIWAILLLSCNNLDQNNLLTNHIFTNLQFMEYIYMDFYYQKTRKNPYMFVAAITCRCCYREMNWESTIIDDKNLADINLKKYSYLAYVETKLSSKLQANSNIITNNASYENKNEEEDNNDDEQEMNMSTSYRSSGNNNNNTNNNGNGNGKQQSQAQPLKKNKKNTQSNTASSMSTILASSASSSRNSKQAPISEASLKKIQFFQSIDPFFQIAEAVSFK